MKRLQSADPLPRTFLSDGSLTSGHGSASSAAPAALPLECSVFDSVTTTSLTSALDNLALRQRVTADNIA
ncbi:MAG: hypothetical protein ACJ71T_03735, partial [Actinomycetales bacterium]